MGLFKASTETGGYNQKLTADENFRKVERVRHDFLWLILLGIATLLWFAVFIYAVATGKPQFMVNPIDARGVVCGVPDAAQGEIPKALTGQTIKGYDATKRARLFFPLTAGMSPDQFGDQYSFCVETCPTKGALNDVVIATCANKIKDPQPPVTSNGAFPVPWPAEHCSYPTKSVMHRCFPNPKSPTTASSKAKDTANSNAKQSTTSLLTADMARAWWVILVAAGISLLLCTLYTQLLKKNAGCMVWTTVVLMVVVVIAFGALIFISAYTVKKDDPSAGNESQSSNTTAVRVMAFVFLVFVILVIAFVIWMVPRIKLTIGIIKEAADAVEDMPKLLWLPLVIFGLFIIYFALWVVATIHLAAANPTVTRDKSGEVDVEFDQSSKIIFFNYFHLFWFLNFFIGICQVTVAGAIAEWYWAADKESVDDKAVEKSFDNVMKYHLGSVAFGSLLIALAQIARKAVKGLEKSLKKSGASDNKVVKFLMSCLKGCVSKLEKLIRFISRNAYIMIGSLGVSYCGGARRAFHLMARNIARVAAVNVLGDLLLFMGKWIITLITVGICAQILQGMDELSFWFFPALLCGLLAFGISTFYMSIFEMSIDTILLSFFEDEERHGEPKYCSERFKTYIQDNMVEEQGAAKADDAPAE